ncbi:hypothetical protein GCM10009608_26770 [Pseudonocardia alaniniphila]
MQRFRQSQPDATSGSSDYRFQRTISQPLHSVGAPKIAGMKVIRETLETSARALHVDMEARARSVQ